MFRRDEVAERMADAVLKRLITRKIVDVKDEATARAAIKAHDDLRVEIVRVLSDETKLEEWIGGEVRKILSSYAGPAPEGSPQWDVLYQKTREEVRRRRFRL